MSGRRLLAYGNLVAGFLVLLAAVSPAWAEVGIKLPDTEHDEVRGARFGEFILVPFASVRGGYNTNVFRAHPDEGGEKTGALLAVTPGFRLWNPAFSWVRLKWDAAVDVNFWFSEHESVKNQGRVSADSTLRADFFPRSVVGFFVADRFIRATQPANVSDVNAMDNNYNKAEAGIQVRPGGALEFALSYAYNFRLYDENARFDKQWHEVKFLTSWDFFPRTSFLIDVDWRYMDWDQDNEFLRIDSMPLRATVGLRGYITKKLALLIKAGYGGGFYDDTFASSEDIQTVIGELSIAFKPLPSIVIDVGYDRNFWDSYYGTYFLADSAHLVFRAQMIRKINFEASVQYGYISYAHVDPGAGSVEIDGKTYSSITPNQIDRRDHMLRAKAEFNFSILRYLQLDVGYKFDSVFTDFQTSYVGDYGTDTDFGSYMAHYVYGGLRILY